MFLIDLDTAAVCGRHINLSSSQPRLFTENLKTTADAENLKQKNVEKNDAGQATCGKTETDLTKTISSATVSLSNQLLIPFLRSANLN